ncbi:MAG: prepilin-type N-terminal cleavage/methylation domain-containing protein [Thermodesulfovibrionales bacterium]
MLSGRFVEQSCLWQDRSQKGFTLLEVLISIAIISIILTALYSSFFMSKKAVDSLDDNLLRLQEMRMTLDVMRREVESVLFDRDKPYTIFRIEGKDIYGRDASSIMFTCFSYLAPGPLTVSYFIEGEENHPLVLRKRSRLKIKDSISDGQDRSVEILEDIESFTVEARYRDEWVKAWDSNLSHDVPEEVRFTIVINVKGRRYALSEVARIRTGRML